MKKIVAFFTLRFAGLWKRFIGIYYSKCRNTILFANVRLKRYKKFKNSLGYSNIFELALMLRP